MAAYQIFGKSFEVIPVKVVIAALLVVFSIVELAPALAKVSFDRKYLPFGGALSGFFGGLSGNQGALRSPFLLKAGLSQAGYIATGVVIACLVDFTRLSVYGSRFSLPGGTEHLPLLATATASAFLGAFLGARFMKKITMRAIQVLVAVMLLGIALGLGFGLI
ncbi:MAG: TSUP family transporter [Syntrophobacteraceae bacterium]